MRRRDVMAEMSKPRKGQGEQDDAQQRRLAERIVEMQSTAIRRHVGERIKAGSRASELAVMVGEKGGRIGVVVALRRAVAYDEPSRPEFAREVAAAVASTGESIPVVVRLPLQGRITVVGDAPDEIRAVLWFDYEPEARGAT